MSFKQEARKFYPKWPIYNDKEIKALTEVIKSGEWWCGAPGAHQGNNVWAFQDEFAQLQGSEYCVAVCNGTVAIEAALMALDVGLGDEVIVSDYTFVASASAVIATNAVPIFCDINPNTLVMDVHKVEELITERTKAIIPVHLGGNPVNMDHLMELALNYDLKVVEDCAHAHGSDFKGKKVGNWGDAGTFSFQASKVLTSGEGGAIICNSEELTDNIYSYIDCGRKKNQYSYKHFSYGTNYRMTEYQAAVLRAQLKKFPDQHKLRNENAQYFMKKLNEINGIKTMKPTPGTTSLGWYVFPIVFEPKAFGGITKPEFYKKLNKNGIPTDDCYPPLHSLDCFKSTNLKKGIDYSKANWGGEKSNNRNFPIVSDIYSRSIEFPQEMLLANKEKLDNVVDFIRSLKEKG
ncbi:MAG TPA: DegT/DnrJ/EryC1/StrS family aminotransferase [Candidatus Nanopelagicaceae bacterium]|nr:DegT/DnrJ/EryC1/StrS family aminotransferase [Candidatus Nanopelagicaceae bacterium]